MKSVNRNILSSNYFKYKFYVISLFFYLTVSSSITYSKTKYNNLPIYEIIFHKEIQQDTLKKIKINYATQNVANLEIYKHTNLKAPDIHFYLDNNYREKAFKIIQRINNPNLLDKNLESLLHKAIKKNMYKCIELLISQNVNLSQYSQGFVQNTIQQEINTINKIKFRPALHQAIINNQINVLKKIIDKNVDINIKDYEDLTPFHTAFLTQNYEALEIILENKADPNIQLPKKITIKNLHPEIKKIIDKHFFKNDSRVTPLLVASATNDFKMVKFLVEHKARKYISTKKFQLSPISIACIYKNFEIARYLLGAKKENSIIAVNLKKQRVTYYKDGKVIFSNKCSSGKKGYRTPPGEFIVTNKHKDWTSTLYNSKMPFFLRLSNGAIGFHAGRVPNYPASHGCIRLPYSRAKKLFSICPVGTKVVISNNNNIENIYAKN